MNEPMNKETLYEGPESRKLEGGRERVLRNPHYLTLYPHSHLHLVSTDVLGYDCSYSSPGPRRRINWPVPRVEVVQDEGWPSLDVKQGHGGGGWEDGP